jgi:hypothetical protein
MFSSKNLTYLCAVSTRLISGRCLILPRVYQFPVFVEFALETLKHLTDAGLEVCSIDHVCADLQLLIAGTADGFLV